MNHAYYQYNKEQLLKNPRLPLICMPDNATVFQAMAKEMFQAIEENNQAGKKTVFICPVGLWDSILILLRESTAKRSA